MAVSDDVYKKLFVAIESRQDEFVERLREAVAIPSVSAEPERRADCDKMTKWTKKALEDLGAETEMIYPEVLKEDGSVVKPNPMVFGQLGKDPKKKTLLIYGHLDVQPAKFEDGWNTQPFELTEKDGKLFGRGSTDDKGPVVAWLNVIDTMQKQGIEIPVNLKFCFECMEESGSVGLEQELIKRKETFLSNVNFSVISDNYWLGPSKPCITYGLRGISYFHAEIVGAEKNMHSGLYGGNVNEPLGDLMWVMSQLTDATAAVKIPGLEKMVAKLSEEEEKIYQKISFDVETFKKESGLIGLTTYKKEELLMRRWRLPSLSLHGVEGAYSGQGPSTIIPGKVIGKFSIRLVPDMLPETVNNVVKEYIEKELWPIRKSKNQLTVKPTHGGKPWLGDFRDVNFQAGARAMKRVFGVEPDFTREGGSIPVTLAIQELTGNSVMLLPIGASDDMAHSQNEKMNRSNYVQGMKTLGAYLLELAVI